jgi:hypothetical protein
MRYLLTTSDMKATTRKAMPANQMLPVRNQTIKAIIPAGKTNRKIFAITMIITIPMTTNRNSIRRSPMFPSVGSSKPNKFKKLTRIIWLKLVFKHFQKRRKPQPNLSINHNFSQQQNPTKSKPCTFTENKS